MADIEVTVIGAGVVGLAVAARLASHHRDLVVLERRDRHGQETSSRNSEVIHSGIYYTAGSLKATLCVEGNERLYAICAAHDIPHRRITKIITAATTEELPALERLLERGTANGVELQALSASEASAMEPHVRSAGALFSPSTGIVSAHSLMDHFLRVAGAAGAVLQPRCEVVAIERRTSDYRVAVRSPEGIESFTSDRIVNAAGLEADSVAALAGIDVVASGYRQHHAKGSYFSVSPAKSGLVSRLVYPVPGGESLGVHAVVGLEGRLRFGPDVEYLPDRRLDYRVDETKLSVFGEAVRRLVPDIRDEDLSPDIAGIRAKLQGKGEPVRDFLIADEEDRGLPGFINLLGIDSPGLTSSPAIAEYVATLLER